MSVPQRPSFNDIPDPIGDTRADLPGLQALARGLSPNVPDRAQTERRRRAALVLSLVWLLAHLAAVGVRHDLSALPLAYLASQVGAPLLLAAASLHVATRPARSGLGSRRFWVAALTLGGLLSLWGLALLAPPPYPPPHEPRPWLAALVCSELMLAWMSAPLFAAAVALRGAFAATPVWRSALVGASVGSLSGATLNLHCANVAPWHLVLAHGVPIALASSFGALVVGRWLRA